MEQQLLEAQLDQAPGPVPASAPSAGASWKEKSLNSFDNCFNGNINYEFYDLYDFLKSSSSLLPLYFRVFGNLKSNSQ